VLKIACVISMKKRKENMLCVLKSWFTMVYCV
jgi:hypothetical protein